MTLRPVSEADQRTAIRAYEGVVERIARRSSHNLVNHRTGQFSDEESAIITALWQDGYSDDHIGWSLNRPGGCVAYRRRKLGLTVSGRKAGKR